MDTDNNNTTKQIIVILLMATAIFLSVVLSVKMSNLKASIQKNTILMKRNKELVQTIKQEITQLQKAILYIESHQREVYESNIMSRYIIKVNPKVFPILTDTIVQAIIKYEKEYNLKNNILLALIDVESDFNVYAKSNANALGLAQINYNVWIDELKREKIVNNIYCLYDPDKNIHSSAYILNKMLKKYNGDYRKALQAYFGIKNGKEYYNKILSAIGKWNMYESSILSISTNKSNEMKPIITQEAE